MAEMTSQDMAGKLLAAGFRAQWAIGHGLERPDRRHADGRDAGPVAALRPRPRKKRNSAYDEIKASIRSAAWTRRQRSHAVLAEAHYIIPQRRQHQAGDPA